MGLDANPTEPREVSAAVISRELKIYARKRWPLGNDKYRKNRLRDLLGLSPRRIRSFWEGEDTAVPRRSETDDIEALIGKRLGIVEEATREYRSIEALCQGLEALLTHTDEDGYRAQIDALRQVYRRVDSAGNSGGDDR